MKGLAIYTLVLMGLMTLFAVLAQEIDMFTKIVCLGMYTPTVILAIKIIKGDR